MFNIFNTIPAVIASNDSKYLNTICVEKEFIHC